MEEVSDFECCLLALMAGDDPGISNEVVEGFRQAMDNSGVENEVVVYSDAPHSFFDRQQDRFSRESSDAWSRVLEFIAVHSAKA